MIRMSTHNVFEYSDKKVFHRQTLEIMLKYLKEILETRKCNMKVATLEQVAAVYRKKGPIDLVAEPQLPLILKGRS